MKKSLMVAALSCASIVSAHAQSSVTLYGVIDTGLIYSNNQGGHSNWQETSAATENTVFGLKGSEDLGGGLHAIFKLENGSLKKHTIGDCFVEAFYAAASTVVSFMPSFSARLAR